MNVKRNINLMLLYKFLKGLMFYLPIYTLYLQKELFTVFNVTLIVAIGSISIIIFEVPSGAIADLFGRKKTIVLSSIISVFSLIFLLIGGNISMFIVYNILISLAQSLLSGTDTAIIYDTLKGSDKKKELFALSESPLQFKELPDDLKLSFKKIIGLNNSMWPLGASISSLIGGFLATKSLRLPIIVTVIPFTLSVIIALLLEEPNYEKETHKNVFKHINESIKISLKSKQLLLLLFIGFIFFASGEVAHKLKPIFYESKGLPIESFGIIYMIMFATGFLGAYYSDWFSRKIGDKNTLILSVITRSTLFIVATLITGLGSALLIAITSFFWMVRWPIITDLINKEFKSKNRATIISFNNLIRHLGVVIFAPILGLMSDLFNINLVFQISIGMGLIGLIGVFFIKF